MDSDLLLVIGLTLAAVSIPAIVAAYADNHPPRVASVVVVIGGVMVLAALITRPGGYAAADIPEAILGVLARVLN